MHTINKKEVEKVIEQAGETEACMAPLVVYVFERLLDCLEETKECEIIPHSFNCGKINGEECTCKLTPEKSECKNHRLEGEDGNYMSFRNCDGDTPKPSKERFHKLLNKQADSQKSTRLEEIREDIKKCEEDKGVSRYLPVTIDDFHYLLSLIDKKNKALKEFEKKIDKAPRIIDPTGITTHEYIDTCDVYKAIHDL